MSHHPLKLTALLLCTLSSTLAVCADEEPQSTLLQGQATRHDGTFSLNARKNGQLPFTGMPTLQAPSQDQSMRTAQPRMQQPRVGDSFPFRGPGVQAPQQPAEDLSDRWLLSVVRNPRVSYSGPSCLVHFRMQEQFSSQQVDAWDEWAKRVLHMVYANLQCLPAKRSQGMGGMEMPIIRIQSNGAISVQSTGDGPNGVSFEKAVTAIAGRPELAFPTRVNGETVSIQCSLNYGPPPKYILDAFGVPLGGPQQTSW